jgi:23S rRNA pseudouridine2605 synthase
VQPARNPSGDFRHQGRNAGSALNSDAPMEEDPNEMQPPLSHQDLGNSRSFTRPSKTGRGPQNRVPQPGTNPQQFGNANGSRRRDGNSVKNNLAGGANQPDPMKTSFGYIGADTFTRQRLNQGQRRGPGNAGGMAPNQGGNFRGRPKNGGGNRNGNGSGGSNR